MTIFYDYVIVGAGVMGLAVARQLKQTQPDAKLLLIEKEDDVARHASGRNSGVLHAGFYYTADSLKATLCVEGNQLLKDYCDAKGLTVNRCGKLVVAQNEHELSQLHELWRRGQRNGVQVELVDAATAQELEPNLVTYEKALYSPHTATVDPVAVCQQLKQDLLQAGAHLWLNTRLREHDGQRLLTSRGPVEAGHVINCGGLYADRLAQSFGFGRQYTMMPFKGIYLKYAKDKDVLGTNLYPVPHLKQPFLGVHYTKTVKGDVKIGPTAIPAFWRENYHGLSRFNWRETREILYYQLQLFARNSFGFRDLAFEEVRKYYKPYFIGLATRMVQAIDPHGFGDFLAPGIRAQLLNRQTLELVQDFVVEGDAFSTHLLNAVSPAFTCSFALARHLVNQHICHHDKALR